MKNLKMLGGMATLTFVLGMTAFAGQMPTDPCASPAPGQMPTDPCASAQSATDYSVSPGETSTPPASDIESAICVAEAAIRTLLLF